VKALVSAVLGLAGAAAWLISRGHKDPRQWPKALADEAEHLRNAVSEASTAGRRAAAAKEREIEKELADAEAGQNRLS
jgi:uncharacterized membrane protein YccC